MRKGPRGYKPFQRLLNCKTTQLDQKATQDLDYKEGKKVWNYLLGQRKATTIQLIEYNKCHTDPENQNELLQTTHQPSISRTISRYN